MKISVSKTNRAIEMALRSRQSNTRRARPLISVVIPTYGRPTFLPEAVQSAVEGMNDNVEVIVVPNGPDGSWKQSMAPFESDQRVRIAPIIKAHANAARNHGLSLARGKYLRFLDDDDLLYPEASIHQCSLLESSGADICSGTVDLVGADLVRFRVWAQPDTDNFTESVLSPRRVTTLTAHVFRIAAISELRWDESISLGQDTHWMHQLCQHNDWPWARTDKTVGVWRHHVGQRISSSHRNSQHLKVSAQYLLRTIQVLNEQGRLDTRRKAAAADGLWHLIHGGFYMEPTHWVVVAKKTQLLFPGTYPDVGLYRHPWGRIIPPVALEFMMLPKRRINSAIRRFNFRRGRLSSVVPP